jgi:O-antigen/teichoic acid export membrane protein
MLKRLSTLPPALRQTLIYGLSLVAVKAVSLLMVPFATHFLTPADYGRLDILQTLADLLSIVIGMGLADTLFRFTGQAKNEEEQKIVAANLLGLALIIGAVAALVTQLGATWIVSMLPGGVTEVQVRLILGSLAMGGISTLALSRMRMRDQAIPYAVGSVSRVVVQAFASGLLLVLGFGVTGFMAGSFFAGSLLALWLLWPYYRDTGVRFDFDRIKQYVRYGSPLIFVGIAGFVLGSFDRWILADAIGTAAMADYALAAKFGLITAIMIQPFDLWWLPRRFKVLPQENGPQQCAYLGGVGVTIGISSAVMVAAIGPLLIEWLTPVSYHGATQYVPWMAFLAVLHNTNMTLGMGSYSAKTTSWPAIIDGCAAGIAVIGYTTLIPLWGIWGTILATAIALSARLLATLFISQRITHLPYAFKRLLLLFGTALIGTSALQLLEGSVQKLGVGIALVVVIAVLALSLKLVKISALDRLMKRTG